MALRPCYQLATHLMYHDNTCSNTHWFARISWYAVDTYTLEFPNYMPHHDVTCHIAYQHATPHTYTHACVNTHTQTQERAFTHTGRRLRACFFSLWLSGPFAVRASIPSSGARRSRARRRWPAAAQCPGERCVLYMICRVYLYIYIHSVYIYIYICVCWLVSCCLFGLCLCVLLYV